MTRLTAGTPRSGAGGEASPVPSDASRPLAVTGAIAACAAAGTGLAVLILLALAGFIAAPHSGLGLPGVLRTAALLWLIGHHVGFTLPGVGRIGMLPLGLVLLPGALLWRAGRWVVRTGGVRRLGHVGYAALALAVPYAMVAAALALASSSARATPSLPEAVICPFLLALTAGGLGGARALAPWRQLAGPARPPAPLADRGYGRSAGGPHGGREPGRLRLARPALYGVQGGRRDPGPGGGGSRAAAARPAGLRTQRRDLGDLVHARPGFAVGTGTVVAPTGSALGSLPAFPMLAALPPGVHPSVPPLLSAAVLVVPYLAGAFGGLLMTRAAPVLALETAPLWGFACGVLTGCVLAILAAFAGGPLGSGRLAAVGPSGWQVGVVASLEVGVAAAVTAGATNWLRRRATTARRRATAQPEPPPPVAPLPGPDPGEAADDGHTIYVNPWAGTADQGPGDARAGVPHGPASLP